MRVVTQGWICQLLHSERQEDGLTLDLVALAECPFDGVDLPTGSPFVIRVLNNEPDAHADLVERWAEDAAVLALHFVRIAGARWLCVSSDERHLLLEIT